MANPSKLQALFLGVRDLDFSFTEGGVKIKKHNDITLLGINIDSRR